MIMKKSIIGTILVAVLAVLVGCGKSDSATKTFKREKISVKVESVAIRDIEETVAFSGRLEGSKDIMVFPQMPGTIERIYVEVGDKVKTGRLLVRMNGDALKQAEAQYDAAKRTFERMAALHADSLISPQSYDQAKAGYIAAKAGYQRALDNTNLRAPFSGVVVGKYFNEHDVYSPGIRGIIRLAKTDTLKLPVDIAAKDFPKLKEGMPARIHTEINPDTLLKGVLENLSPGADPITGLFSGDILIDNKHSKLPVGIFADADVITDVHKNTMVIPRSSVVSDSVVFVYSSGKVSRKVIEKGLVSSETVEVLSGLDRSDSIVTKGAVGLKDGLEVHVIEEAKK